MWSETLEVRDKRIEKISQEILKVLKTTWENPTYHPDFKQIMN